MSRVALYTWTTLVTLKNPSSCIIWRPFSNICNYNFQPNCCQRTHLSLHCTQNHICAFKATMLPCEQRPHKCRSLFSDCVGILALIKLLIKMPRRATHWQVDGGVKPGPQRNQIPDNKQKSKLCNHIYKAMCRNAKIHGLYLAAFHTWKLALP